MRSKTLKFASVALAAGLVLTACGDDEDPAVASEGSEGTGGETADNSGLTGSINIEGSSTVFPITDAAKFAWEQANGDGVAITVGNEGTTAGFEQFCSGETDISDASRPIKDEEIEACTAAGVEFVELEIAFDGLTVMVNPNNDDIECLAREDLYALIGPEAEGTVENWTDAQALATELGSDTVFPDLELFLTGPGTESGTYGSFIELALDDITEVRFEGGFVEEDGGLIRNDYNQSGVDETIIDGIESNDGSLGWVGFSFAEGAGDAVKEVAIQDDEGECILPTDETISDGSYPLSRSLFIYVNEASIEAKPEVPAFVDFYLEGLSEFVEAGGYVLLPEERLAATQTAWEEATA